jgi:hypothetical protein
LKARQTITVERAAIANGVAMSIAALSLLLIAETEKPSGFFLKKKPPCSMMKEQHVK